MKNASIASLCISLIKVIDDVQCDKIIFSCTSWHENCTWKLGRLRILHFYYQFPSHNHCCKLVHSLEFIVCACTSLHWLKFWDLKWMTFLASLVWTHQKIVFLNIMFLIILMLWIKWQGRSRSTFYFSNY